MRSLGWVGAALGLAAKCSGFQVSSETPQSLGLQIQYSLNTSAIGVWEPPLAIPKTSQGKAPESIQPKAAKYSSRKVVRHNPIDLAYRRPPFKSRSFTQPFSPSGDNETAHFQVYDDAADALLGDDAQITLLVKSPDPSFQAMHEAPVYYPDDDSFYWCSNAGAGGSNVTVNNKVFRFADLRVVTHRAKAGRATFEADVEEVKINSPDVQMTNGATNYGSHLLLVNSGRGAELPGSLTLIDRDDPTRVKVLLNNIRGRHFNAPNDVVVHPRSGYIFFTDPLYAQLQHFKSKPDVAPMTWAYSPLTGQLTALDTTGVHWPNGLAFSPDGKTLYVTDTSAAFAGLYEPRADLQPTVVYAFDVHTEENNSQNVVDGEGDATDVTHSLRNRRVFAHVDTGIADGIKTDNYGNVYGATGDGVDVWSPTGKQLLKIFLPFGATPNIAFAGHGRLVALADDKIWLVELAKSVEDPGLANRPGPGKAVEF